MDLQISVFLLFILFTAGHSLYCYECTGLFCTKKTVMCPLSASNCMSSTVAIEVGAINTTTNVQGCSLGCVSGSINFGMLKSSYFCCGTSFCNARNAQDPRTIVPNGKKCYYCDGQSCSNILSCSGTEDRCITATGTFEGWKTVVKGCVSKAVCDSKTLANTVHDISCCKGDLCNDDESDTESATQSFIQSVTRSFVYNDTKNARYNVAQRVTQSFLFLCCSLLSFILLH